MDPLVAGLALPAAIKASLDVIDRLLNGPKKSPELTYDLKKLTSGIEDIRGSLITFSRVTEVLKPWKLAHHATNLVLYREMEVMFTWNRTDVGKAFERSPERIRLEFGKANMVESSRSFLQSKSDSELELGLPEGIVRLLGVQPWYRYLVDAHQDLERSFERSEPENFWVCLVRYRDVAKAINHRADTELLDGLTRIGDRLDEIRDRLTAGQHDQRG